MDYLLAQKISDQTSRRSGNLPAPLKSALSSSIFGETSFSTHLFPPHVFVINFLLWLHFNPYDSQSWDCLLTPQFIGFHITNITQLPLPLFPPQWDNEFQHLESNFHLEWSSLQLMIQFKTGFVVGWESHNRMHHYLINGKETKQVWKAHRP